MAPTVQVFEHCQRLLVVLKRILMPVQTCHYSAHLAEEIGCIGMTPIVQLSPDAQSPLIVLECKSEMAKVALAFAHVVKESSNVRLRYSNCNVFSVQRSCKELFGQDIALHHGAKEPAHTRPEMQLSS